MHQARGTYFFNKMEASGLGQDEKKSDPHLGKEQNSEDGADVFLTLQRKSSACPQMGHETYTRPQWHPQQIQQEGSDGEAT